MRSQGCIKYWINVFHILRYKSVFVGLWVAERHLPRGRGLVISRNKTFFHTILYCDETVIGYGVLILLSSSRWRVVNVCPWKLFWCGSKRLSCVLIEWGHRRWYGLKIQWTLSKSTIFFLSKCKLSPVNANLRKMQVMTDLAIWSQCIAFREGSLYLLSISSLTQSISKTLPYSHYTILCDWNDRYLFSASIITF